MKLSNKFFITLAVLLALSTTATAGDFGWTHDFNIRAEADPSGFRARLAARFQIGDFEINTVISNVERPSDAYIVFRLGEMSGRPSEYVVEKYKSGKGRGWGVIAKSLGIKPGSKDFHALKRGNDLYDDVGSGKKSKNKNKNKHKVKN